MEDTASDSTTESPKGKKAIGKLIIIALVLIGIIVGFNFLPVDEWWKAATDWIEGLGVWGPIAFIALYVVCTVFFIPGSALTLGAGAFFGVVWGSLWVIIGANIGANVAFLIGRFFARDAIAKKTADSPTFQAIDRAVGNEGWKIVGLTRLSPVFPFTLLNYAFGLTGVKWIHYALASFVGMLPGTIMYVYIGSLGKLAAESDETSTAKTVLLIAGLVATVLVTVVITRAAKKALAEKTDIEVE
ncbi:MAG: TVP38/TMEM64 family protein [Verrucomicrobiota bacterium]